MKLGGKRQAPGVLAVVCSAVLGAVAVVGCGTDEPDAAEPAKPVITGAPVATFAPLISLHDREKLFPITAESFISHGNLTWGQGDGYDVTIAGGAGRVGYDAETALPLTAKRLGDGGYRHTVRARHKTYTTAQHTRPFDDGRPPELEPEEGYYIDILTEWFEGRRATRREADQVVLDARTYYDVDEQAGERGLRVTYWFLFGRHRPPTDYATTPDSHEGDWERVSVLLRRTGRQRYVPISLRLHQRGHDVDVPWTDARLAPDGKAGRTHPVVYMANGSHTPYPGPVSRKRRLELDNGVESRAITLFEEAKRCRDCPEWRTWEDLRDVRKQDWYGYGGAWGYTFTEDGKSGPIGPSPFTD